MIKVIVVFLFIVSAIVCEDPSVQRCARAAGSCLLASQATEGPFYWNSTVRKDITEGKGGIPFRLTINVLDTTTCSSLSNAVVDIWQCDATGIYSHYTAAILNHSDRRTDNSTFFRGQQVTDVQGIAVFDTTYPGWYPRRATHIHVKVHVGATLTSMGGAIYAKGGHVSYVGQIFFNDTLTDEVAKLAPYNLVKHRRLRNNEDGIYNQSQGPTTIIPVRYLTSNGLRGALSGDITLGINPNTVSAMSWGSPQPRPGR